MRACEVFLGSPVFGSHRKEEHVSRFAAPGRRAAALARLRQQLVGSLSHQDRVRCLPVSGAAMELRAASMLCFWLGPATSFQTEEYGPCSEVCSLQSRPVYFMGRTRFGYWLCGLNGGPECLLSCLSWPSPVKLRSGFRPTSMDSFEILSLLVQIGLKLLPT